MRYQELAAQTEAPITPDKQAAVSAPKTMRLLHGAMGVATEAGEIVDALKCHIFYGADIDETNILEEVGDLQWYLALILNTIGASEIDSKTANIAKLQARFGDKFSESNALNRDLDRERKALEG